MTRFSIILTFSDLVSRNFFIIRLCYSAGNACKRVTISSKRNDFADSILKIRGFKKADNRLRHSPLSALIPFVDRMPILIGFMKIVSVYLFNVLANLLLSFSIPGHPDSSGSRLCALDAFRMVVSDCGRYGGTRSVSAKVSKNQPTALTRIAAPLPHDS